MKCPKCGYISFETSDSCRKCSNDLSAFRQAHGLTPIVLPAAVRASMAKSLGAGETEHHPSQEPANDAFTFDLPQHESLRHRLPPATPLPLSPVRPAPPSMRQLRLPRIRLPNCWRAPRPRRKLPLRHRKQQARGLN